MSRITTSRITARLAFATLASAGLVVAMTADVGAQAMMNRGPNINIGARVTPNINIGPRINVTPHMPNIRYSPEHNLKLDQSRNDPKTGPKTDSKNDHRNDPPRKKRRPAVTIATVPPSGGPPPPSPPPPPVKRAAKKSGGAAGGINNNFVRNEVIIEVDGQPSQAAVDALARRHRLSRIESQTFELTGTTLFRWRIPDSRSVDTVQRQLAGDGSVRATFKNYRFALQQAKETPAGDPAQYAVPKMKLSQAHGLASGQGVVVAVIDSGVDVAHPELAGVVVGSFDALKSSEKPHAHGTGIAGAIAAHARLLGAAPRAQLLAVRAFGVSGNSADSTSFNILKGLEYSVTNRAQVINMSFAGPTDPLLARALATAASRGIVLIAAAGNAGPKSPPLFPGSDKNVIAVSATDSTDRIFSASNRGKQIAIAAPGVDILVPAPDGKYQVTSGTSFAAAYISGLAALMLDRKPGITPDEVRSVLTATARDLGPRGRDDDYGAGLADAFSAVTAVDGSTAPVAVSTDAPR